MIICVRCRRSGGCPIDVTIRCGSCGLIEGAYAALLPAAWSYQLMVFSLFAL
jgi:hypothetical protein